MSTSSKVLAACIASLFGILATSKTDTISKSLSYVRINGITATFVIDTFWLDRYVDKKFVEKNYFIVQNYMGEVTLAGLKCQTLVNTRITGVVVLTVFDF